MSYQVLARKWRPKTFREMVGQEHVLKALINALDHNRLHHAYLFTGTRGVGKTTIARILAKCLNCETGVSSAPCDQCTFCTSISDGRFVDLIEVDAASRTKVEDTRELLENVQYAPTSGRYKVFLIDEVHMLSTHSFNALLKTLEEPPPHVKFLLATTDPQKLPATVLSRCLQFNLKNMSPEGIVGHLKNILEKEMVAFDEQALWQLGRAADGSMRDALSLTDQAIAFGAGKLSEVDVRNMLGTIDRSAVHEILDALIQAQGGQLLAAVQRLSEHAPDYSGALEELLTLLHRVAIAQTVPDATDNTQGERERILSIAANISAEDVQLFYQIALNGRRDLPLAPDARSGFEMVLLRMLAFKPVGVTQLPQGTIKQAPAQQTGNAAPAAQSVPAVNNAVLPEQTPASANQQTVAANRVPASAKQEPASPGQQSCSASKPATVANEVPTNPGVAPANQPATTPGDAVDNQPARQTRANQSAVPVTKEPVPQETVPAKKSEPARSGALSMHESHCSTSAAASKRPATDNATSTQQGPTEPAEKETLQALVEPVTLEQLTPHSWSILFERLGFSGVVGNIASHCVLDKVDGSKLYLLLDDANATLFNDSYTKRIEAQLSAALNTAVSVSIRVAPGERETPAAFKERREHERKQAALGMLQNDPYVQCLMNDFSATLDTDSVRALATDVVSAR